MPAVMMATGDGAGLSPRGHRRTAAPEQLRPECGNFALIPPRLFTWRNQLFRLTLPCMELEVRHLRALCAIADAGSLHRAARQLGVAQPP